MTPISDRLRPEPSMAASATLVRRQQSRDILLKHKTRLASNADLNVPCAADFRSPAPQGRSATLRSIMKTYSFTVAVGALSIVRDASAASCSAITSQD